MARLGKEAGIDLEGMEVYIRQAMLSAGGRVLERMLEQVGRGRRGEPLLCADNHLAHPMRSIGLRSRPVRTLLGEVEFTRSVYVCPVCGRRRIPGDEALGLEGTLYSPGARRLCARAGSDWPFGRAAEGLLAYAGLHFDEKEVERVAEAAGAGVEAWMAREGALAAAGQPVEAQPATLYVSFDGTGVPMRAAELRGRKGKAGKARTREAKLGCVFTQTRMDEAGRPVRDEDSTTYVGAIEESRDFAHRIRQEALRRGMGSAGRVVALTDGAAYNKTILQEHFPNVIQILDLYHAREHLAKFSRDILRSDLKGPLHLGLRELLDAGKTGELLEQMQSLLPHNGPRRREGLKEIVYLRRNAHAMRYGEFRSQGLFVGLGVIEAGCRTVVGQRLKNSGMFWSRRGANAIIALRCCILSGRFEDFWADQAA